MDTFNNAAFAAVMVIGIIVGLMPVAIELAEWSGRRQSDEAWHKQRRLDIDAMAQHKRFTRAPR